MSRLSSRKRPRRLSGRLALWATYLPQLRMAALVVLGVAFYGVTLIGRGAGGVLFPPRTADERAALLASGDCALAASDGHLVGHVVAAETARHPDRVTVEEADRRHTTTLPAANVRIVPCARVAHA